ncbi:DUF6531 domain-containing protein [Nannocystaceae bacterium ST9]
MSLQSTFFDPVVGLDIHLVGLVVPPAPSPIPTPMPMAFVGLVFDPFGLLFGAAIGMLMGGGPGIVLVNGLPATNCGTEVTNGLTMPHVSAPGVYFMKTMLPVEKGDAELYFGSLNVTLAGSFGVRLGDIALSCSNPIRLPTSIVLAIPKGAPVLNMPPMVPDLAAIAMAAAMRVAMRVLGAAIRAGASLFRALRRGSAFMRRVSDALGGCFASASASRWRQMWSRAVRFITGHPVDVVTGNMFTDVIDVDLPGPLPLTIERVYESAGSGKPSTLGYGWSHSLDESLWMERGRAVVRLGDGREIEFGLWDLPERTMRPGDVLERVIHKLTLHCVGQGRFEVHHADGRIHEFASILGGDAEIARLVRIRSLDGHHAIELHYDSNARLEWVRDACDRLLHFEHDGEGRLVALGLPRPDGQGFYQHRRYRYDDDGDLVEVEDSLAHKWHYEYRGHLLVQEIDRAGLSFYFQYDDTGANSKCIRTWGDGGIYDHVITYDVPNHKTFVENSCGEVTIYQTNVRNQVVAVTNALGQTTQYEYDPETGEQTLVVDPLGARTTQRHDHRGNLVEIVMPDGDRALIEYEGYLPTRAIDPRGGEWGWRYQHGRLVERTFPSGGRITYGWAGGLLVWSRDDAGHKTAIQYDVHKNLTAVLLPNGARLDHQPDALGRAVLVRNPLGGETRFHYDTEGRIVRKRSPTLVEQDVVHDPEGNVLEVADSTRRIRLGYGHFHRVVWREEAGTYRQFEYDTEDRLLGVVNEAGERYGFVLDPDGRVLKEIGFDGRVRRYNRDRAGRVIETVLPSGRRSVSSYDVVGRVLEVKHSDGCFARFEYERGGFLRAVENETALVEFERDLVGRVIAERCGEFEVRSRYDVNGYRIEMATSLGARVAIERDPLGEVQTLFMGDANRQDTVAFERDAAGLEVKRRFSNGIDVRWERDNAGRPLVRRTLQRLGVAAGLASAETWQTVDERQYEWRGEDQIASITEATGETRYEHDTRGRLIREQRGDEVIVRAMDAVGNVYKTTDGSDRRYGRGGRIEAMDEWQFEHDEDGNLIRKSSPDGSWRYEWNGHGMLVEVERPDGVRVQFEYDAFARRIGKRVMDASGDVGRATKFVWDEHLVVHGMTDRSGVTTWHWEPESFTPIAKEQSDSRVAIATDHLGIPTATYDKTGNLVLEIRVDIFGIQNDQLSKSDPPLACEFSFPGQFKDPEVADLCYNRFRYYSTSTGTYISSDPVGLDGGLAIYAYVTDPTFLFDPLGLSACKPPTRRQLQQIETLRAGHDVFVDDIAKAKFLLDNMPDLTPFTSQKFTPTLPAPRGTFRGDLINTRNPLADIHPEGKAPPSHARNPHYNLYFFSGKKSAIIISF